VPSAHPPGEELAVELVRVVSGREQLGERVEMTRVSHTTHGFAESTTCSLIAAAYTVSLLRMYLQDG
jgi:hypothetical protein